MIRGRLLSGRPWLLLAVVGLLGVAVVSTTATAGASGTDGATIAKKKCKKKRSASSAKKKKCKKKKIVLPAPGPLVRGTLTWSGGTATSEVDLHAFDASGNHTGWVEPTGVVNGIPNAVHSGDVGLVAAGTETFTDNIFVQGGPANREFSYVACRYGSLPSSILFTGVASNGQSSSVPIGAATETQLTISGGPPVPASFSCP